MKKWYAVYTRSRAEKKVAEELKQNNIEHYLPLYKTLRQWSDRKKKVEVPLFTSYIFVHISVEHTYFDVLNTPGVVCFIKFSNKPAPIPEKDIEKIRTIVASGLPVEQVEPNELAKGDKIEIINGPLKNYHGELIKVKGKEKVLLRLDSIDKNLMVDISLSDIKKMKKNA